jgi:hypothetical protein
MKFLAATAALISQVRPQPETIGMQPDNGPSVRPPHELKVTTKAFGMGRRFPIAQRFAE